jgi:hypothetical protein
MGPVPVATVTVCQWARPHRPLAAAAPAAAGLVASRVATTSSSAFNFLGGQFPSHCPP